MEFSAYSFICERKFSKIKNVKYLRKKFTTITPNLNPGDCLVHHCLTVHGSNRNKSNFSRKDLLFNLKILTLRLI